MKKSILISFLLLCCLLGFAQSTSPKREMRAGWLATVSRTDWPNTISIGHPLQIQAQKNHLDLLLNNLKGGNVNTVLFQVRSRADAMYESSYEPWSVDVSGTRGTSPGYDPLKYAVEEAHKRGMELHVWINPYRFESVAGAYAGLAGDYSTSNPDWVLKIPKIEGGEIVGWATILDPGNPDVQKRIKDIIAEIVTKYDVDGVIFDDYFYLENMTNEDSKSAGLYKPTDMSIGDWRRQNVNTLIADVNSVIKSIKPYLLFGVGPRGYWSTDKKIADQYGVTLPATQRQGSDTYASIYCDALAWMKAGTIDYISPQIYWATDSNYSYTVLCKWWSEVANKFKTQIYISQDLSDIIAPKSQMAKNMRIDNQEIATLGLSDIERRSLLARQAMEEADMLQLRATPIPAKDFIKQVNNNREFDKHGAPGSIFFSCWPFNLATVSNMFVSDVFQNKSLRPAMWIPYSEEGTPENLRIEGSELKWDYNSDNVKYTVYAIPNSEANKAGAFATSAYLQDVSYTKSYAIPTAKPASSYTYAVAVLDKFGNEFAPVVLGKTMSTGMDVTLSLPLSGSTLVAPFNFSWQEQNNIEYYIFELAEDASFQKVCYKREVTDTKISTTNMNFLNAETTYYWRVKAVKANATIGVSPTWNVGVTIFNLTFPTDGSITEATPTIKWTGSAEVDHYLVEVANNTSFNTASMVHSKQVNGLEYIVPTATLAYGNVYYVRVKSVTNNIETTSDIVKITTETQTPPVPVILTPENNSKISGNRLTVTWEESIFADRFRVELAESNDFFGDFIIKTVNPYTYETVYENLTPGEYYVRVRARYAYSFNTAWSEIHKVILAGPESIKPEHQDRETFGIVSEGGSSYLEINTSENITVSAFIVNLSGVRVFDILKNQQVSGSESRFILPEGLNKGVYVIYVDIKNDKKTKPLKWVN